MPLLEDLHSQSKEFVTSVSYLGIGVLATLFLCRCFSTPKVRQGTIRKLGGFPIFTAWKFFTKRYDFFWANFGSDLHFQFKVLQVGLPFHYIIHPELTDSDTAQCSCFAWRRGSESILRQQEFRFQRGLQDINGRCASGLCLISIQKA